MSEQRAPVLEPGRQTPVLAEYDVVVLGGGPAGIVAAAAAGRSGRSTLLIERYGFLGGAATAAGVTNFCGLHANVHGEHKRVVPGFAGEFIDRIDRLGGLNPPHLSLAGKITAQAYDTSAYKVAADEFLAASGVRILFHAFGVGMVKRSERAIDAVLIESKSGRHAVRGRIFIDCSGDGDLSAWAGAPFEIGDGAGNMLYPSTHFRINGVDPVKAGRAWEVIPKLMEEAAKRGRQFPRKGALVRPQKNPLEWRANVTQIKNADGTAVSGIDVEQLSDGEIQGRRQSWDVFEFIKEFTPGFENSYIVDIAPQIGIRETRRIVGAYLVTEGDILGCASFADSIGVNGWPVEAHVPGSVVLKFPPIPESRGFNQLPYRMIVPKGVDNLFVAGRCASMTHGGQSSARVSGSCFVMGQAAGTAAGLAMKAGVTPAEVDVPALQRQLVADGAYLGRDGESAEAGGARASVAAQGVAG